MKHISILLLSSQNHNGKKVMVANASCLTRWLGDFDRRWKFSGCFYCNRFHIVCPFAGNLGDGGFMFIQTGYREVITFEFREKAPLASTKDMFLDENDNLKSDSNHNTALAIEVQGIVENE